MNKPELWTRCLDDEAEGTLTKWTGLIEDVGLAVRQVPLDEAVQRAAVRLTEFFQVLTDSLLALSSHRFGCMPPPSTVNDLANEVLLAALGETHEA